MQKQSEEWSKKHIKTSEIMKKNVIRASRQTSGSRGDSGCFGGRFAKPVRRAGPKDGANSPKKNYGSFRPNMERLSVRM